MNGALRRYLILYLEEMPEGAENHLTWRTDARLAFTRYQGWCSVENVPRANYAQFCEAVRHAAPRSVLRDWNGTAEFSGVRINRPEYR